MLRRSLLGMLVGGAIALAGCGGSDDAVPAPVPKVIIDSDYNTMSDDGQLGVMAMQLHAAGKIKLLGISVVSGNQWLKQGVSDALKAVERMGLGSQIGVYSGANYPLSHPLATVQAEQAAGAGGDGYLGAWSSPEPLTAADLVAPLDGFATSTTVQTKSAVDFLVDSIKANPHEITILAIGPLTNIALAVRQNPEIVPLIKKIIYMGGAVHVPGNTTTSSEFNFWFDPEAAQTVLRLPIPQVMLPLDVTDTVLLTEPVYRRVAHPAKPTIVSQLFQATVGLGFDGKHGFENDPNFTLNIWDSLTMAYLMDPSYATETSQEWVDVVTAVGINNGQSIGYTDAPPAGVPLQKMTIVKKFDNARYFDFYVDLLTRPVPVSVSN